MNEKLTRAQEKIAQLIEQGKTIKEIMEITGLAIQTVKAHTHQVYKKSGVQNKPQYMLLRAALKKRSYARQLDKKLQLSISLLKARLEVLSKGATMSHPEDLNLTAGLLEALQLVDKISEDFWTA